MSVSGIVVDHPIGMFSPIGLETVCGRLIRKEEALVRLCAPGVIQKSSGAIAATTIPSVYYRTCGKGAEAGVSVSFEVADETAMSIALDRLVQKLDGSAPDGFVLEASSSHLNYVELAQAAAPLGSGDTGGCECCTGGSTVLGAMRVGLNVGKSVHWSDPVPALMFPRLMLGIDLDLDGQDDDTCTGVFLYDCHSHWQWSVSPVNPFGGVNPRYTVCHNSGTCPAGTTCKTTLGTPVVGWKNCNCL